MEDSEILNLLKQKVTQFSPELQRLQKVDMLLNDKSDGMSDLHEREVTAIALYRALHNKIIPIPATMMFLDEFISLRRSRDRLGRQEWVNILKGRPAYVVNPYFDEPSQDQNKGEGIFSRIFGLFRRKKPQA